MKKLLRRKKIQLPQLKEEEDDQHLQETKSSCFCSLSSVQALFHILFPKSLYSANYPTMETPPRCKFTRLFFLIVSLSFGLISCISCIVAEIKRNKKEDLRWSGNMCYLPSSPAFGCGIAALICFFVAQIIGNSIFFKNSCSEGIRNAMFKIPAIAKVLFLISWFSFGFGVILLITATSMSRRQPFGVGWLNGECYLVKGGTYAGASILILVALGSITGSALSIKTTSHVDEGRKILVKNGISEK